MSKKKGGPKTGKKSKHRFSFKEKAEKPEKPSPFAMRSSKLKFDILGRKVKGDKGNVLKAREAGYIKRKDTLLKEHQASGKSNAFVDRRFGEDDASMTPEERAIGRLARTRLRQIKRGSGFNLNDDDDDDGQGYDDEEPITLTHGGKPIDEREEERRSAHAIARGRRGMRDDDSDDDMAMDAATTGALHFGGGEDDDGFEPTLKRGDHDTPEENGDPNRRKTKKEVMDELIDKSKYHKAERARQRERDEDLLDKLDDEFKEISRAGLFRAALSKGVGHLKPDGWERGKKGKDAADVTEKDSLLEKKMTSSAKEALELAAKATNAEGGKIKDDYDKLARELALESRGQATDRIRTQEEVDAAEAAALETAERARLKRMNAVESDDDGLSDSDGPATGGYAARRAKAKMQADKAGKKGDGDDSDDDQPKKKKDRKGDRMGGDDLDGNFDLSEEEEEEDEEDQSGSEDKDEDSGEDDSDADDLDLDDKKAMTKAFKKEANKMGEELDAGKKRLRKLGILEDGGDMDDSEEEEDDSEEDDDDDDADGDISDSGDEDEYLQMERMRKELEKRGVDTKQFLEGVMKDESDEDDDDDEEDEDEEEDADDDEEDNDDEEAKEAKEAEEAGEEKEELDFSGDKSDSDLWSDSEEQYEEGEPKPAKAKDPKAKAPVPELPFTFPMPETSHDLEKIVGQLSVEDTTVALERIRKCHAPTLKEDNRKKMQSFLGLLLQRFEMLSGQSPLPVDYLDVLAVNIAAVANIVPFFAVTSARARLEKMAARLRQRLRDGETGWPPARTILLISLFADIFPTTDKQHPVSTPAALYLGNVLAHCAVRSTREAVTAVVVAGLAARYSAPAGRIFPEAITLLAGLVHAAGSSGDDWSEGLPAHARDQIGGPWLAPDLSRFSSKKKKGADENSNVEGAMSLAEMLVSDEEPGTIDADAALHAALSTLKVLAKPALGTAAAGEILAPVTVAVARLALALSGGPGDAKPAKGKKRAPPPPPPALTGPLASAAEVCRQIDQDIRLALAGRQRVPLVWREKKVEAIKTFNPMFEEQGYSKGRDYDPNRERAEKRKLQREIKKEKRGAIRELRKDNRFLAEAVAREREAAADERGERQRETLSFLEKMESDLKSGGQGGMIVKNQRRVNGPPKRDRKKR